MNGTLTVDIGGGFRRSGAKPTCMTRTRFALACAALALAASLTAGPTAGAADKPQGLEGVPAYRHVAIIILENEDESTTFGPSGPATYLNSLVPHGVFDPNYYGTGHVSLDNYIAMTSAQPANRVSKRRNKPPRQLCCFLLIRM